MKPSAGRSEIPQLATVNAAAWPLAERLAGQPDERLRAGREHAGERCSPRRSSTTIANV